MNALLNTVRREPVRCAYVVIIAAIAGYAAVEQIAASHPKTLVAAVPMIYTVIAGEIARAKVTPVAKLLNDHAEDKTIASLVDDLVAPGSISPHVDELEADIPPSEQLAPPEPVGATGVLAGIPLSQLVEALVPMLQDRLGPQGQATPPASAPVAAAPAGDALDAAIASEGEGTPGSGA